MTTHVKQSSNTRNKPTSTKVNSTLANYVFGMLFLCNPDTINALKENSIFNLRLILNTYPSFYLATSVIYDAKKNSWELFVKLATVKEWTDNTGIFSFAEEDWDLVGVIQVKQDYSTLQVVQPKSTNCHI